MRNFPTFGMMIVVLTTAMLIPPIGIAKDELSKSFVFREIDAERTAPEKLDFRENASAMIEIDALSVFDSDSTENWTAIHDAASNYIQTKGSSDRIHIRFYHSDYRRTKPSIRKMHTKAKCVLADLDVFVVMVDEQVRNDQKPWADYVAARKKE